MPNFEINFNDEISRIYSADFDEKMNTEMKRRREILPFFDVELSPDAKADDPATFYKADVTEDENKEKAFKYAINESHKKPQYINKHFKTAFFFVTEEYDPEVSVAVAENGQIKALPYHKEMDYPDEMKFIKKAIAESMEKNFHNIPLYLHFSLRHGYYVSPVLNVGSVVTMVKNGAIIPTVF